MDLEESLNTPTHQEYKVQYTFERHASRVQKEETVFKKNLYRSEIHAERTERQTDILPKEEPACKKFQDNHKNMVPMHSDLHDLSPKKGRRGTFHELVETMKMKHYLISKLILKAIQSIGLENMNDKSPKTIEDVPWNYLRKLMALNRTARDIALETNNSTFINDDLFNASLFQCEHDVSTSIHPLDVLCVLLHCSDSFLQQEIVTRMAMCQFAVPLLLPAGDGSHCTLMLWAMRDIVKKWKPQSLGDSKGFREENVVNISMPVFSFVRLGKNKLSKSKILNQILNPAQQNNNFFIHDDMDGGNIEQKISEGLVEISWYFPCGTSDVFPEPIAVTNLRGDLDANRNQFKFLTRVSTAVFIFIESISEEEVKLLSSCPTTDTQYYFIITPGPGKHVSTQTLKALQELSPVLQINNSNVITYTDTSKEATFVDQLQESIIGLVKNGAKKRKLVDLVNEADQLHINVDERVPECQVAREKALKITAEIKDVAEYKQTTMVLQGDLWKEVTKVDKELCRMTNQRGKDAKQYQDELKNKRSSLHAIQNNYDLPSGITLFIDAISSLSKKEKQYFLKWLKFGLESITRNHLSALQAEYKEKCNSKSINIEELRQIDQEISNSSLGIEHFLREMGQFYEAECSLVKENKINKRQRKFAELPGIAADLLFDGFPLELIDRDAANIPLRWITDVLMALDEKTGGKCRMRVITVLGLQSTGKSTLLNTMFGLQFPVASGRCTKGAFMTLLNVKENFQEELGCEFIMVIDSEGLKAPELSSLEENYEHDNELATLLVGLSDTTIVNMAMENTTEMKDILQIVVHAFLRMKEVGKKPNCQFVHQNVSDVSAHDKNMGDRKTFLKQLNKTTKVAAKMEEKGENKTFSDVMDYDLEKDNWYIPGLWLGVPPMASINSGYSEHVSELKKYLLDFMITKKSLYKPLTITEFIERIESLWNAVKHEKFIFSFRNSLVAEAYMKLCREFSKWERDFRKAVYDWQIRSKSKTKNCTAEGLSGELRLEFSTELDKLLNSREKEMLKLLKNYFDNKHGNVHLIEQYKQDFIQTTTGLKGELRRNAFMKFDKAVSIQKGKLNIQNMETNHQKMFEEYITALIWRCKERKTKPNDEELKKEFEKMWERTLTELQIEKLETHSLNNFMLQQLWNEMSNKGPDVNQYLLGVKDLEDVTQPNFKIDDNYIASGRLSKPKGWQTERLAKTRKQHSSKIKDFSKSLISNCLKYVSDKVDTGEDYDDTYCRELLNMINTEISKHSENLHLSIQFELDIKLHILGKASREFQRMHDKFIKRNDPKLRLEKLKPEYLGTFISIFKEKDLCQTKVKDVSERYSKQRMFCDLVVKIFISEIRIFRKHYFEELSSLCKERTAVKVNQSLHQSSVSDFQKSAFEIPMGELVIPQNAMQAVTFQNTAATGKCSPDIQSFLQETERQILSKLQSMVIKSVLSRVTVKPQDELFRKVVGYG